MATITHIPLEILSEIAVLDVGVWRGLLAVRMFGLFTLTQAGRILAQRAFKTTIIGECTDYHCQKPCICEIVLLGHYQHSFHDEPAVIHANGTQEWYRHGLRHRGDDKPAIVRTYGLCEWYWRGKQHRAGGEPALVDTDGYCEWYQHGVLHRGHDLPAIVYGDGSKKWYRRGYLHRDNGPAIIYKNGTQIWAQHGVREGIFNND